MRFDSKLIHGGISMDEKTGAVSVPIYQASTYKQPSPGQHTGFEYSRTGNPTREAVEKLIADLEDGVRGFAFASGMAAMSSILMLFTSGDHIIISDNVYGGTFRVLDKIFVNQGLEYTMVDTTNLDEIAQAIQSNTQGIIIETPTNPVLKITDIKGVSEISKAHDLLLIVDNTFMTPYLQQPIKLGADIVVHSATKYLGGHSDLVAGLVAVKEEELAERVHFVQNSVGAILGPQDSWLLMRGIKTLGVRMDRHVSNARKIAQWLAEQPEVTKVFFPANEEHPGAEIHQSQASGPGGMISFEVTDFALAKQLLERVRFITLAESLGGVESLISLPALMTHASIPAEDRAKLGISDALVRLSVGIENVDDLIEDLEQALRGE